MASGCVVIYRGKRGLVYRIKFTDSTGRQVMETLGPARAGPEVVWTRRRAEKALRDRLGEVEAKRWRRTSPVAFEEWARRWLDQGETRRDWKPRTTAAYTTVTERLIAAFKGKRLADLRPADVAAYVAKKTKDGLAAATVNRDVSILHDILKVAVREELIGSNPAAGAERPRLRQKRWRILTPAEVAKVARSFTDEQARVAFLVLVMCGLRRHELQALRWKHVDLVEDVLRVTDSKTEDGVRSIAIPPSLAEALWQHRRRSRFQGDERLVFHNPDRGTVYRAETFAAQFAAALKKAGITDAMRPFHDLRHTAITNDAASGSSPIAVMTKAGHSDMRTTKRYLHLAGVVFRDEAERLERRYGLAAAADPADEPQAASRTADSDHDGSANRFGRTLYLDSLPSDAPHRQLTAAGGAP